MTAILTRRFHHDRPDSCMLLFNNEPGLFDINERTCETYIAGIRSIYSYLNCGPHTSTYSSIDNPNKVIPLIRELRRRNLLKVVVVYETMPVFPIESGVCEFLLSRLGMESREYQEYVNLAILMVPDIESISPLYEFYRGLVSTTEKQQRYILVEKFKELADEDMGLLDIMGVKEVASIPPMKHFDLVSSMKEPYRDPKADSQISRC